MPFPLLPHVKTIRTQDVDVVLCREKTKHGSVRFGQVIDKWTGSRPPCLERAWNASERVEIPDHREGSLYLDEEDDMIVPHDRLGSTPLSP